MTRYYEETALIEFVKQYTPTINGETIMECVERAIRNAPTADVVPKSEVERLEYEKKLIFDEGKAWHREAELNAQRIMELEAEKEALIKNYAECMKDYAREIFEEIESKKIFLKDHTGEMGVVVILKDIAEFKKKYIGEHNGKEQ